MGPRARGGKGGGHRHEEEARTGRLDVAVEVAVQASGVDGLHKADGAPGTAAAVADEMACARVPTWCLLMTTYKREYLSRYGIR